MVSRSVSRSVAGAVAQGRPKTKTWSPLALFSAGERGAWYDPSDVATLFQDAAGTIPITASGQAVGLMLDKSGNGYHLRQSSTTRRPTYMTDGKLHWLTGDGNDVLVSDSVMPIPHATLGAYISTASEGPETPIFCQYESRRGGRYISTDVTGTTTSYEGGVLGGGDYSSTRLVSGSHSPGARILSFGWKGNGERVWRRVNNESTAKEASSRSSLDFNEATPIEIFAMSSAGGPYYRKGKMFQALLVGRSLTYSEELLWATYASMSAGIAL